MLCMHVTGLDSKPTQSCVSIAHVIHTITLQVTVPSELTALMSGERLGSEPHPTETGKKVFRFQQKVPIPSYLVAIVVGALESRYASLPL